MRRARPALLPFVLALLAAPAAPQGAEKSGDKPTTGPKPPVEREYSYVYDLLHNSVFRPVARTLDPARLGRLATRNPREAANVDANGQVRLPSTWWQPRLGFREVTVAQMLRGPGSGRGPVGKWKVTRAKSQGVTPGFQIEDENGDRFIIKFDPVRNPEMSSGADVIGSCLFWAAGYNVPDNTIAHFRREDLVVGEKATVTLRGGRKIRMTDAFLDQMLTRVPRRRDGSYRALASRFIDGKPLGPFKYEGRRKDDPEDLVPHQHRRELRGLYTFASWVNHADVRGPNSLDSWVTENGRSFVRHHLIDFGSILGSSAIGSRSYVTGTEYYMDYNVMGRQLVTLGLAPFEWEDVVDPKLPSVGFVESRVFNPATWRPDYPNPAFDERTLNDVRWGARIVAGFTDAHIRAAVEKAQYSNPAAAEYLVRTLVERRDKIVRHWLGEEPPASGLARPAVGHPASRSR